MENYSGSGFVNYYYWVSGEKINGDNYVVKLTDGSVYSIGSGNKVGVVCRQV